MSEGKHRCTTSLNLILAHNLKRKCKEGKVIRGEFSKWVTNCDWKETNGDNYIQTTFIFQRNLHTNLNTCPTVSQVSGKLRRKILVVAVWTTRTLQTDWMLVFDTCSPFLELLHQIMDCLTWQAVFTVRGQHFFLDILCCRNFTHKNRTRPRCSIVVHVFRGAAIL